MSSGYTAKEKREMMAQKISSMNADLERLGQSSPEYEKLKAEKKALLQEYYDSFNKLKVVV